MRSPAAAIAWEFRARHRWGLIALAVYLVVLVAIKLAMVASGRTVALESAWSFALVVVVPLTTTFMYFLAVFSFGLAGDLAARPVDVSRPPVHAAGDDRRAGGMADALRHDRHGGPVGW